MPPKITSAGELALRDAELAELREKLRDDLAASQIRCAELVAELAQRHDDLAELREKLRHDLAAFQDRCVELAGELRVAKSV
jgi:hypothetical protein